MDDLARWYGAQLDEDERIVKAAPRGPWSMSDSGSIVDVDGGRVIPSVGGALDGCVSRWPELPVVDHVLAHDPARVLREIDAKRRTLIRHCAAPVPPGNEWAEAYPYCAAHAHEGPDGAVVYPVELKNCPELRDLAASYADRPGFREEWRP